MSDTEQTVEEFTADELAIIVPFLLENHFLEDKGDGFYSPHIEFCDFFQGYFENPLFVLDFSNKCAKFMTIFGFNYESETDNDYAFWVILMVLYLQSKGKYLSFELDDISTLLDSGEVLTSYMRELKVVKQNVQG